MNVSFERNNFTIFHAILAFLFMSQVTVSSLAQEEYDFSSGSYVRAGRDTVGDGPIRMREGYPTLEAAAQAALQDAWKRSLSYGNGVSDTEFGGVIFYSKEGGFGYTTPATSERYLPLDSIVDAASEVSPLEGIAGNYCSGCSATLLTPESEEVVGIFHTHPNTDTLQDGAITFSEYLSDQDRFLAEDLLAPNFMRYQDGILIASPNGDIRELPIQPPTLEYSTTERDFFCSKDEPLCDDREGDPPQGLAPNTGAAAKQETVEKSEENPETCLASGGVIQQFECLTEFINRNL